jgi:hypothetical protein
VKLHRVTVAIIAVFVGSLAAFAQDAQPPASPQPAQAPRVRQVIPLEVQITISRYQGDKRISAIPYVLAVNTNSGEAQLTMNVDLPVATTTFVPASSDDKSPAPLQSFNYRGVGTNIVCGATTAEDGRYELTIGVDESTVVPTPDPSSGTAQAGTRAGMTAFRNFKSRNRLLLRDGQTRQYTAATDRITGETVRIEVSLKVVK